jgi:hypothetical protein
VERHHVERQAHRERRHRLGWSWAPLDHRGSAGSYRRSGLTVWPGSQIGTGYHQPSPVSWPAGWRPADVLTRCRPSTSPR